MMTKEQALVYGKEIGVRYLVMGDNGTLYGGSKNREEADRIRKEWNEKNRSNPWIDKMPAISIMEVET